MRPSADHHALAGREIGKELISLGTVDSTNTVAAELAERGAAHGTVVIAEAQRKGRGRLGRTWVSPAGVNIYMSIILRPCLRPAAAPLLTIAAAVACVHALRTSTGLHVEIKWPNDLMVGRSKLGGILTEVKSKGNSLLFAVIGIGINVNSGLEDFPPGIREEATSVLLESAKRHSCKILISSLLKETGFWYEELIKRGSEALLEEWRRFSSTTGSCVRVAAGNEVFEGIAEDIDGEGRLMVRLSSGALKPVSAGDVTKLR
ncbi:MAG: biotin--[acetyl-CoA-carboxylase] ligase [Nitrospirae bacterium]|nr:biotin--[acetyl-CoA-carboxylase] ligase [Nitrospirota bacterium]